MDQTQLIAFDLDDTLAPSKTPLPPPMAELLVQLLSLYEVCVISGGQFGQFQKQVIEQLVVTDEAILRRLHLMPTCGTQYYRHRNNTWEQIYAENLNDDEKERALSAVRESAMQLGLWEPKPWGPILEDRGSQVTFSALGQDAPVDSKRAWDRDGSRKGKLRAAVALQLPDLEVRSGGSTSIDITRKGIDKAYGMTKLTQLTGIPLSDMLFVGDRLDEAGNDYPVKAMGVRCHAVTKWEDTAELVGSFIAQRVSQESA